MKDWLFKNQHRIEVMDINSLNNNYSKISSVKIINELQFSQWICFLVSTIERILIILFYWLEFKKCTLESKVLTENNYKVIYLEITNIYIYISLNGKLINSDYLLNYGPL